MKRGMKFLSTAALVVAVAWVAMPSETVANCGFNSIIGSGGFGGNPVPQFITAGGNLGGEAWEIGFGDPAIGVGNDLGAAGGPAAGSDRPFIRRTDNFGNPLPGAALTYDWAQALDNCLNSGTIAGTGSMATLVQEEGSGDYVIMAVTGTAFAGHDFDKVGPVSLAPFTLSPNITVNSILDDFAVNADVGTAASSANCLDDGANFCVGGPVPLFPMGSTQGSGCVVDADCDDVLEGDGLGTCSTTTLCDEVISTGTELFCGGNPTGCLGDGTNCTGISLPRDAGGGEGTCCWDTNATVVANQSAGPAVCIGGVLDTYPCDPNNPGDACLAFAGVCPPGALVTVGWTDIPAGCTVIAGPSISDVVLLTPAAFNANFIRLNWSAEQFTITHFDVIAQKPNGNGRTVGQVLRQGSNDGSLQDYELIFTRGDVRGARNFTLRTFLTDGSSFDSTFE